MSLAAKIREREQKAQRVKHGHTQINARVPIELKARGDAAIKVLGLKWIDVFTFAIESVIERAEREKQK